jgi:hypothetical protein
MKVWSLFKNFFALIGLLSLIFFVEDQYYVFDTGVPLEQRPLFDYTVVGSYPNSDNSVIAILQHGVTNTGASTAPFYRLVLKTKNNPENWLNNVHVWNSQVRQKPNITWLNESTVEITQDASMVWDYNPSIKLNEQNYAIKINVL